MDSGGRGQIIPILCGRLIWTPLYSSAGSASKDHRYRKRSFSYRTIVLSCIAVIDLCLPFFKAGGTESEIMLTNISVRVEPCTIYLAVRRSCWKHTQPLSTWGGQSALTDYKGSHILMNNGSWIDFSKSGCYSTIYTHFLLSISMALNFWCDNWGQSFLPSKSHKSGEISQSGTRFGQHFGQLLSSLWFDFTHTLVDDGQ